MNPPQPNQPATSFSTNSSTSTSDGIAGQGPGTGNSTQLAGNYGDTAKKSQVAAVAQGSPSVKSYGPRDIRDSLVASRCRSSARIEADLLALALEIGSLPPDELEELKEVSRRGLDLSVLPLVPERWQQTTNEVRNLGLRGLHHPSNLHLTFLDSQRWFWDMLLEAPVWLLHVPITPNMEPIPILVQSREKPCPGDNLVLASIHQVAAQIQDQASMGETLQDALEAPAEIQVKVLWAVVRAQPEDVKATALGAIADRCFFRALAESQFSLSPKSSVSS